MKTTKILVLLLASLTINHPAIAVDTKSPSSNNIANNTVAATLPVISPITNKDEWRKGSVEYNYAMHEGINSLWLDDKQIAFDQIVTVGDRTRETNEFVFNIDGKIVKLQGKMTTKRRERVKNEFQYNGFTLTLKYGKMIASGPEGSSQKCTLIIDGRGVHKEIKLKLYNGV